MTAVTFSAIAMYTYKINGLAYLFLVFTTPFYSGATGLWKIVDDFLSWRTQLNKWNLLILRFRHFFHMISNIRRYLIDMESLAGALNQHLSLKSFMASKQTLLQAQEMKDSGGWLLINGLAKQYRYNNDGKFQVTGFWRKGDVILLPQSFLKKQEANDYIELVEDSFINPFRMEDIDHLERTLPELRIVSAISNVYLQRADIRLQLIGMKTNQAIKHLASMYPLSRIRNKDIASYLLKDRSSFYRAER